jgi:hypothetical protein
MSYSLDKEYQTPYKADLVAEEPRREKIRRGETRVLARDLNTP